MDKYVVFINVSKPCSINRCTVYMQDALWSLKVTQEVELEHVYSKLNVNFSPAVYLLTHDTPLNTVMVLLTTLFLAARIEYLQSS